MPQVCTVPLSSAQALHAIQHLHGALDLLSHRKNRRVPRHGATSVSVVLVGSSPSGHREERAVSGVSCIRPSRRLPSLEGFRPWRLRDGSVRLSLWMAVLLHSSFDDQACFLLHPTHNLHDTNQLKLEFQLSVTPVTPCPPGDFKPPSRVRVQLHLLRRIGRSRVRGVALGAGALRADVSEVPSDLAEAVWTVLWLGLPAGPSAFRTDDGHPKTNVVQFILYTGSHMSGWCGSSHPGSVDVRFGTPLSPSSSMESAPLSLRDCARGLLVFTSSKHRQQCTRR